MNIIISKTVAFTGYRADKLRKSNSDPKFLESLAGELETTILGLYQNGYDTFLSGMCDGFDLLAAEAVLRLQWHFPQMRLIPVIPFQGQELSFSERDKERFRVIYNLSPRTILISEDYHRGVYFRRNDFLIEHASMVVCYFDGQWGGTMYTVNLATLKKIPIINLCKN